jgi:hypothetical protein
MAGFIVRVAMFFMSATAIIASGRVRISIYPKIASVIA